MELHFSPVIILVEQKLMFFKLEFMNFPRVCIINI